MLCHTQSHKIIIHLSTAMLVVDIQVAGTYSLLSVFCDDWLSLLSLADALDEKHRRAPVDTVHCMGVLALRFLLVTVTLRLLWTVTGVGLWLLLLLLELDAWVPVPVPERSMREKRGSMHFFIEPDLVYSQWTVYVAFLI